jgi:hypothetical protein
MFSLILSAVMARLDRAIQYSRGVSVVLNRLWNTGRPVKPGDDLEFVV